MTLHRPRLINLLSYILFAISFGILAVVVAFTMNVDVLKDWNISLPAGDIHAGDTITIQSTYTKLRAVTGTASRYLDCTNASNAFVRYPINEAVADRAPGSRTGTGVILKIPTSVPSLPASCRISIIIRYQVYPWRAVTEFNSTNRFTLLPAEGRATGSSAATQTSQAPAPSQVQSGNSFSSPNTTTSGRAIQQDTSQPEAPVNAQQMQPQPTLLQSFLNSTTSTVKGLINVL